MAGRIVLLIVLFALGAAAAAPAAEPLGLVPSDAFLRSQVKEPVFAWAFALVEADSLGRWDAADLGAFCDAWTNPSDFPLERLASFRREAPAGLGAGPARRPGLHAPGRHRVHPRPRGHADALQHPGRPSGDVEVRQPR